MTQPRMLLGGAALALLLVVGVVFEWYRNAAPPPHIVVTGPAAPEPPSPAPAAPAVTRSSAATAAAPKPALKTGESAASANGIAHASSESAPPIMVHVVGAVKKPGVYHMPPKARLADAVHAAGGPKAGADLEAVNLASFVQDGEQIRVPTLAERRAQRVTDASRPPASRSLRSASSSRPSRPVRSTSRFPLSEATPPPAGPMTAGPAPGSSTSGAPKKGGSIVNINTADEAELQTIPGVGPKTAAAIFAYRQEHGPFQRIEDLMEIRGIGEKKLARMRDCVTVR